MTNNSIVTYNDVASLIENKTEELKKEFDSLPNDFETSRDNIQNIIVKGNDAFNDLVELAKQAPLPRTYEALASLMKVVLDANKSLLELHQMNNKISNNKSTANNAEQPNITNNGNTNIIMLGSTKDILRLIKENKEKILENDL